MRKFLRWITSMSLGMLLFWWFMVALFAGGGALLMVVNAHGAERVHYINYDTDDGSDYLTTTKEEWSFFKDIGGSHVPWTFVDLQRDLLIFRQDVEFEGGNHPICFIFSVEPNGVEYARYIKDVDKLNIVNSGIIQCAGVENWFKEELRND